MKDSSLSKIQGWFENLDRKVEQIHDETRGEFSVLRKEMVTKQQFENRFQVLLTALLNLNDRVDEEIKQIRERLH